MIHVDRVSKRFQIPNIPKSATLKEHVTNGRFSLDRKRRVVEAISDVSFEVGDGRVFGVIGNNGSGKTTLLRLLAGVFIPDEGTVHVDGKVAPLLALGSGFHPDLTGRENARLELLVLGVSRRDLDDHMKTILDFSELGDFIDLPLRTYSSGMAMRLAFATATSIKPDVLLIDEALSVGDQVFAAKCIARIDEFRRLGTTTVFVSHNGEAVVERCDAALWLHAGRVAALGPALDVVNAYYEAEVAPLER